MKKTKKNNLSTVFFIIVFIVGLSLLLYPTVSDYWNSIHQSRAIASYVQTIADLDEEDYEAIWQEAVEYNEMLYEKPAGMSGEAGKELYNSVLNISGQGIMGYVEIPKIKVTLPIYHGTDESVLQVAIGHIQGTSLPVGGPSTHCVISGHRGLPSAKLFTDLDQLVEGDVFMMRVLNETLTYQVDQISVVDPKDAREVAITEGKDYCTLVTCTPYGVNSHRMLVRGQRIDNMEETMDIFVTADATQVDPIMVAPVMAVPVLLILLVWVLIRHRKR